MVLRLRIENESKLPDGGPIVIEVNQRGLDIGRDQHLDWTLPDPERVISGTHCEIRFTDGAYWLRDVSTNGTFLEGEERRIKSPYCLKDGDRLEIGRYIISAAIEGEHETAPIDASVAELAPTDRADDIWTESGDIAQPIEREKLLPPRKEAGFQPDFLDYVAETPDVPAIQAGYDSDPWQSLNDVRADPNPVPKPNPNLADIADWDNIPAPAPSTAGQPADEPPMTEHQMPPFEQPAPSAGAPEPQRNPPVAEQTPQTVENGGAFLRHFARGAGLPIDAFADRNANELAEEIGVLLRITAENLKQLLSARAAAKTLVRSSDRTMVQAVDNNPLKFLPTSEEALKAMLGPKNINYLDGQQTLVSTFEDLKTHQLNTYSAMQYAIGVLVEDLSPEAIETATKEGRNVLGTRKAKLWETYESRWRAKTAHYENGLTDAFMVRFSEWYDQNSGKS